MRNLLILAVVGTAVYFIFFKNAFKKDFYFNGVHFVHVMDRSLGEAHNHIYTRNGESEKSALTFIQIVEFSEHIQKRDWPIQLTPVRKRYGLKPFKQRDSEYTGTTEIQNMYVNSFAVPIKVNNNHHLVLYVTSTGDEEKLLSTSEKKNLLDEMKKLETVFN